jgi:hypothetical protein
MEEGVVLRKGSLVLCPLRGEEYCCVDDPFGLDLHQHTALTPPLFSRPTNDRHTADGQWWRSSRGDALERELAGGMVHHALQAAECRRCLLSHGHRKCRTRKLSACR